MKGYRRNLDKNYSGVKRGFTAKSGVTRRVCRTKLIPLGNRERSEEARGTYRSLVIETPNSGGIIEKRDSGI